MNLAQISIKRPIFVTCLVILMLALGYLSLKRMPVDLFPNITFPIVMVNTVYPGAGPAEVETLVSKVLEDEISTLPGIKTLRSTNREGLSTVVAEFTLETDIKFAEQQIRDRVGSAKIRLPEDIKEPMIRRMDPADQPILILALTADLPEGKKYDLADQVLKPKIEQVPQVGSVEIHGGRKREIRVELDRRKLKSQVAQQIGVAGQNIPAGKVDEKASETVFRTLGEFKNVSDVGSTVVSFFGNDVPVTVNDVGTVVDTLQDEKSRATVNGKAGVFMMVQRQSGANTIAVAEAVKKRIAKINEEMKNEPGAPQLTLVRDGAKAIVDNVNDVKESIIIGIALTILVVYMFLGNGRSTVITGLALPNSLIGAFLLMALAGFSINVMSLLALSLAVGLLIDDAIVVRENIFRHGEMGEPPIKAALNGTKEVTLAVIATTMTVIAVFGSIGFLQGIVGQFFKEFGLTICFAMAISLFDALAMAPMLSAYYANAAQHGDRNLNTLWGRTGRRVVDAFGRFQDRLEDWYGEVLKKTLKRPKTVVGGAAGIFVLSLVLAAVFVPKTFLPVQDNGEFMVSIEMPPGTSLDRMSEVTKQVDDVIRSNKEIEKSVSLIGMRGEANSSTFFIGLVPSKERRGVTTTAVRNRVRDQLKPFAYAKPVVKDFDMMGGGIRPFSLNIVGTDLKQIEDISQKVFEKLKIHPGLEDAEISYRPGKPEFQVVPNNVRAQQLGVSTMLVGQELRAQVEGVTPALFRESGREYDIRVRLKDDQRNLREGFKETYVPNINRALIRLGDVAKPVETTGPANIDRQDRARYIQIGANIAPNGPGMAKVIEDVHQMFKKDIPLPSGVKYSFVGQAESFKEMGENMMLAAVLGVLFIFLVLASLYESFITPFTIMLVLPLAACGAFIALFIARTTLDIFSIIGCIMLLGISTKNSILLVDYTNQLIEQGMERSAAIIKAGKTRLRPILMTTGALIAGMLPIAIGLNEASKQRTSMGVAVVGGLISSTLLTLVVIPASYTAVDRFRIWAKARVQSFVFRGKKPKFDEASLDEPEVTAPITHPEANA